jgi:hypothetical protein
MSKRGNKSVIKINNSKSISGGSGKGVASWTKKKKKNFRVNVPSIEALDALKKLGISLIIEPEELEIDKLKLLVVEKIKQLAALEKEKTPHKLNLDKKSKEELVGMINILQNGLINYIKTKHNNT